MSPNITDAKMKPSAVHGLVQKFIAPHLKGTQDSAYISDKVGPSSGVYNPHN